MGATALRRIGYWRPVGSRPYRVPGDDALPDPRLFVDDAWDESVKIKVIAYLKKGWVSTEWMGHSYCRFYCGISDSLMGSRDFTDGVWVWPEGLHHYIEFHSVRLPAEFIDHLEQRGFEFPTDLDVSKFYDPADDIHTPADLYAQLMAEFSGRKI